MRLAALAFVVAVPVFVAFLARGRRSSTRDLTLLPAPWGDRPSIFEHVRSHLAPGGVGLTEGGEELPDESRNAGEGGVRWAPGARDGVFSHHTGAATGRASPSELVEALRDATRLASAASLKRAYDLLSDERAVEVVDPLVHAVVASKDLDRERLRTFARWLVTRAPDRAAVKVGLALLGTFEGDADRERFLTLGRHDEFTLFSAVALQNSLADPEPALFELANSVDGWGRIQALERLTQTKEPRVKRWMVREGYKNTVMYEYLAHLCATVGGLRAELEAPEVDDALLDGAADILQALIEGQRGPAAGIDDYADGAHAATLYLQHLRQHLPTASLAHLLALRALRDLVDEPDADWGARAERGWTREVRSDVRKQADALIGAPRWRELVDRGLTSPEARAFNEAGAAAKVLGIDTWEVQLERVRTGTAGGSWFEIARTRDRDRMARVVELAERLLPLDRIATGPGTELGLGSEWSAQLDLDSVLQELGAFPGLGWSLVRSGLRSAVTRNRNMALRVLSEWGPQRWPPDARALLVEVRANESEEDLRQRLDRFLEGQRLGE